MNSGGGGQPVGSIRWWFSGRARFESWRRMTEERRVSFGNFGWIFALFRFFNRSTEVGLVKTLKKPGLRLCFQTRIENRLDRTQDRSQWIRLEWIRDPTVS